MKAIETFATFDEYGQITIEQSLALKNRKVKLLILIEEEEETDFYAMSLAGLANAYAKDEPDYETSLISEPNDAYATR